MFCQNCGKEMNDDNFCTNCGWKNTKKLKSKSNHYIFFIIAAIIIFLLLFFVFKNKLNGLVYDGFSQNILDAKMPKEKANSIKKSQWVKKASDWYYYDSDGNLLKGQITPDEYYTDENTGKRMTNFWLPINGKYFYFGKDGKFVRDAWVEYENKYYYILPSGEMATSQWINDEYYVGQDGAMLENATTPDGNVVGSDGKVIGEIKKVAKIKYNADLVKIYLSDKDNCKFDEYGNLWIDTGSIMETGAGSGVTIKFADGIREEHYEESGWASPYGGHTHVYTQVIDGEKQNEGYHYDPYEEVMAGPIMENVNKKLSQFSSMVDSYRE